MKQKIYQADAFTDKIFSGNPAAVCPLNKWLNDDLMQKIAMENNLAETAFFVRQKDNYDIRWFTPKVEVDLCGHATLASAFVLFNFENHKDDIIHFNTLKSGILNVKKNGDLLTMDFPSDHIKQIELTDEIASAFNIKPISVFKGKTDLLLEFDNEEDIINLNPDFNIVSGLDARGIIVTAPGKDSDFVSRFFAPQVGVNEDPVTGSAHTTLTPFWSDKLGKNELTAIQLSERKGYLTCKYLGNRVEISGKCRLYLEGEIFI